MPRGLSVCVLGTIVCGVVCACVHQAPVYVDAGYCRHQLLVYTCCVFEMTTGCVMTSLMRVTVSVLCCDVCQCRQSIYYVY